LPRAEGEEKKAKNVEISNAEVWPRFTLTKAPGKTFEPKVSGRQKSRPKSDRALRSVETGKDEDSTGGWVPQEYQMGLGRIKAPKKMTSLDLKIGENNSISHGDRSFRGERKVPPGKKLKNPDKSGGFHW